MLVAHAQECTSHAAQVLVESEVDGWPGFFEPGISILPDDRRSAAGAPAHLNVCSIRGVQFPSRQALSDLQLKVTVRPSAKRSRL